MKKKNIIFIGLVLVAVFVFTFSLFGCKTNDNKDNENIDDNMSSENDEIVKLDLNNYKNYFFIQEEIITYDKEEYKKQFNSSSGSFVFDYIKASQTTKISIMPLKKICHLIM